MNNKEVQSTQSIFDGARRLLHRIPKVAAGIVGLSGFAYVIGWVYVQSYFSVFGAKWLITEIPVLTLMGYSWWPVIVVLFFAYLGITDLAEIESKRSVEDSRRFKWTCGVLNYGRWIFTAIVITDLIIGEIGYPVLARILSFISMAIVIAMATSAFEILAFRLSKSSLQISLSIVYLTYAIICFGFYLAPTQMGRNAALQDKAPETLSLPFVVLRDEPAKVFRLLTSSGERFYIFPTKYDATYPPIQIVTASQIQSVQKRIKREIPK
ncbi:MAG: hypothetical protein MRK02_06900 [Candidatus Scalindua sp.]|nr:hypothetical protein [Candidatus Scalindua sp.]